MAGIETLSWVDGDAITAEKLQTMVGAIRKLAVDQPRVQIQDERNGTQNSPITNVGNNLKIAAGTVVVNPDPNSQIIQRDVRFASGTFTTGNAPIVIAQLASTDRIRSFVTVSGFGDNREPSAAGFHLWVAHQVLPPNAAGEPQQLTMARAQTVFWLAIGY